MITLAERAPNRRVNEERKLRQQAIKMKVAAPGIVQAFDSKEQTVTVQLAIREKRVHDDGREEWVNVPPLVDVPVVFPRAGGYVLTFPVKAGDECLVIFGDNCMDAWWQSGGIQNQIDCRRHDLSDGYAILGPWSQPRTVKGYSTEAVQLRNESGSAYVEISGSAINIVGSVINIKGGKVNINE